MAYTSAPETQTYSTDRIPMMHDIIFITGESDFASLFSGADNVIPFKDEKTGEVYGETRNGINAVPVTTGTGLSVRGSYIWEKTIGAEVYYYVVVSDGTNTTVYSSNDTVSWPSIDGWADTSRTPIRFTEFISSTNTKSLVMVSGTKGYVYTDNTSGTEITDADFPSPHLPFPVFLNGRLHLAKANTGDIYCSDLDDPSAWTAGNFISSEVYPDDIQALLKVNNYILAVGTTGSEFFYDAAVATGSPLQRDEGGVFPFGTAFPNSIASNKNQAVFIAGTGDGDFSVMSVEGNNFKQIPASEVLKSLGIYLSTSTLGSGRGVRGNFYRQNGELFYLLNYNCESTDPAPTNPTLLYSFSTQMWSRLSFNGTETFPIYITMQGSSVFPFTYGVGHIKNAGVYFGPIYSANETDSISSTFYDIAQTMVIPTQTFGTFNRKFMHRLSVNYVRDTEDDVISVETSDDNMHTYSTSRELAGTMQTGDGGFPMLTQLGAFRNRGFRISSTGTKTRWNYIEVDINKGQQ